MGILKPAGLAAFIRRPDPDMRAVLIFGPDAGGVRERAEALVKAVAGSLDDPFRVAMLHDRDLQADPARLLDEVQSQSLIGGRRAIWVREAGAGLSAALPAVLEPHSGDGLVVAEAGSLPKSSGLRQGIEKAKNALALACYEDNERDLAEVVRSVLSEHGLTIASDAQQHLLTLLGGDRLLSRGEVERLALYCHGKGRVTLEDVEAATVDAAQSSLDQLIDAVFEGDAERVLSEFPRLEAAGTAVSSLLSAMAFHAARLERLRLEVDRGKPAATAVQSLRPPIFFKRADSMTRQIGLWNSEMLARASATLFAAIAQTREHSIVESPLAERTLVSLARTARAAGMSRA